MGVSGHRRLRVAGNGRADLDRRQVSAGRAGNPVKAHKQTGAILSALRLEAEQVAKKGDQFVLADDESIAVESRAYKMSKSRGNVINPDDVVDEYGADSLRLYEMFMGPLEAANDKDVF